MTPTPPTPATLNIQEEGDPATDERAFRRTLGQYPTGVTIVTARHDDAITGMAVNSFAAVSLAPPLVLWSIRKASSSAGIYLNASHFAISILSANQVSTSQIFGGPHPDRLGCVRWSPGRHGIPLIDGAIAHLECRTVAVHEGGDHAILIGEVERHARFNAPPLVFSQGRYAITHEHPDLEVPTGVPVGATGIPEQGVWFMRRLRSASEKLSEDFEVHRQALGLSVTQSRVLAHLQSGPADSLSLQASTYLADSAMEDAIAALSRLGYVQPINDARVALTPSGQAQAGELARRVQDFARTRLQHLPQADVAAFKRVLTSLNSNA